MSEGENRQDPRCPGSKLALLRLQGRDVFFYAPHHQRAPTLLVLAGALMAVLTIVIVGTVPEKADAAGRFKKVIKDFRNTTPLRVPGPGFDRGHVRDVNLIFRGFTHNNPDDVDMVLVHRGVNRTVMSDIGGGFDVSDVNIILDDEAVPPLPDDGVLSTNAWKPENYQIPDSFPAPGPSQPNIGAELSGFDGTDPNGGWQLYAYDDNGNDITGTFAKGWIIQITARVRR